MNLARKLISHERGVAASSRIGVTSVLSVTAAVVFLSLFVLIPFLAIFDTALRDGIGPFFDAFSRRETIEGIRLTLFVTGISVPLTVLFGLFAAWLVAKFRFPGRNIIVSLIDLPLALSPIVVGIMVITLFGRFGFFGAWLETHGIQIIYRWPGLVLTNILIILPFVAREVLPTLEELGNEEEEAAVLLGASGLQTFLRVTLPNIKWALIYGVLLAAARSAGEFGAASIVSGLRRGRTVTLPIQIELYYAEYQTVAAFASATLFTVFAVITVLLKATISSKRYQEVHIESAR